LSYKSDKLKEMIMKHEGLRLWPYLCTAGKLTIGYGRNLTDRGITTKEAQIMLSYDIAIASQDLYRIIPEAAELDETRYNVLVDMMFNLGYVKFKEFKKMIEAVKKGDYYMAANEMLDSRWANQTKGRALELALMMKEG